MAVANNVAVKKLREIIHAEGEAGWDKAWQEGLTPWEQQDRLADGVRPLLKEVMESGEFPVPKEGRAIVPGCGRGFDAVYLGRLGLETWGIDLSEKAVEAAQAFLDASPEPPKNVTFKADDFLTFPIPEGGFTLAYDYTFFCAIPLTMRADWGKRMTEIVEPGGYLVALVWPIDGDRPGGPPYSVDVAAYDEVLGTKEGKWTKVVDRKSELSATEAHKGRESIAVWKREGGSKL